MIDCRVNRNLRDRHWMLAAELFLIYVAGNPATPAMPTDGDNQIVGMTR